MMYTVKRIDEDLDFGCEERLDDAPVMALVTLVDSSGKEVTVKAEDAKLYERNINEGDKVWSMRANAAKFVIMNCLFIFSSCFVLQWFVKI